MKKRWLPFLLALLFALVLPLSGCQNADAAPKAPYYERLSLALQNTLADTSGKTIQVGGSQTVKAKIILEELSGLEELGVVLPFSLPLSVSVRAQSDMQNKTGRLALDLAANGASVSGEMLYSPEKILITAPSVLSKNIVFDVSELTGDGEGFGLASSEDLQSVFSSLESYDPAPLADALLPYGDILDKAIPKEARSTEKVEFETATGPQTLDAKVITLDAKGLSAFVSDVLGHVKDDEALQTELEALVLQLEPLDGHPVLDDVYDIISIFVSDLYDNIDGLLADIEENLDLPADFELKWVRPLYKGSVCGDILTVKGNGETVLSLRAGYTQEKEAAKGFLSLAAGETELSFELRENGGERLLVANLPGDITVMLDSKAVNDGGATETKTKVTIASGGVSIQPLTITTRFNEIKDGSLDASVRLEVNLPADLIGSPLRASLLIKMEISEDAKPVTFPAGYDQNVYDLEDEEEVWAMQGELMAAFAALLTPSIY